MSADLKAAFAPFVQAMRPVVAAVRTIGLRYRMALVRASATEGDRHIERILRDCVAKRQDVETTARRLMVASDIAQVLDGPRCDQCQRAVVACRCEQERARERDAEWWAEA